MQSAKPKKLRLEKLLTISVYTWHQSRENLFFFEYIGSKKIYHHTYGRFSLDPTKLGPETCVAEQLN